MLFMDIDHVYKKILKPFQGEILPLSKEHCNRHDKHAGSIMKGDLVVGHVPMFQLFPDVRLKKELRAKSGQS